jgi:hypothetical protein
MLRIVLIAIGLACLLVLVGLPLVAAWLAHHDETFLDPGDID